jgi:ABC-2 type transport system permease protein
VTDVITARAIPAPTHGGSRLLAVYRVELRKLRAQWTVRFVMPVLVIAPWVFILLIKHQDRLPLETLYGRFLKTTGFATPMTTLAFSAAWILPLLAAIVGGDIFSSEDNHGTLKTVLTRSISRNALFAGKVLTALTWTLVAVTTFGFSALVAGLAVVGAQPMETLGGTMFTTGGSVGAVVAAWAVCLMPAFAYACIAIAFSVAFRSSVVGVIGAVVVGFVMQLYAFLNGWDFLRHILLSTAFYAWHGVLDRPAYYEPLLRGVIVSAVYVVGSLAIAYTIFRRRDVTGG